MKTKAIASTGDFFSRVEANVKTGWTYPQRLVRSVSPGGKWGNIEHFYFFDGRAFNFIANVPTWATGTPGTKYAKDWAIIKAMRAKYGQSSLQTFVTERK